MGSEKDKFKMTIIFNKTSEKEKRRELRKNQTLAEKTLWMSLRKKQINGIRFLRQYSVNHFVIDFYSPSIKLAIEVDGSSHIGKEEYDKERQNYIESFNIKVIRFTNEQVMGNANKTVEQIKVEVERRKEELKLK